MNTVYEGCRGAACRFADKSGSNTATAPSHDTPHQPCEIAIWIRQHKLHSIEDQDQTDHVTILANLTLILTLDLDLWPWLTIPDELGPWPIHSQYQAEVRGQMIQKLQRKRTDGRTWPIALSSPLTRSLINGANRNIILVTVYSIVVQYVIVRSFEWHWHKHTSRYSCVPNT